MTNEAVKLSLLQILEVSGVDFPAHNAPGWMVAKAEHDLTAAINPPAKKVDKIQVAWGEGGGFAVTHEDAPTIVVFKNGVTSYVRKDALDPGRAQSAGAAAGDSSSPAPPAVSKAHQSRHQMRQPDGKFRQSRWRSRTPAQPKFGGAFFP